MFTIPASDAPDGPWPIFERLLVTHEEMAELKGLLEQDVKLAFMFRGGEWARNGRGILGMCMMPEVKGELRDLFGQLLEDALGFYPDFLIVLNGDWWTDANERQREILIFHEALHAGQARDRYGAPKFRRDTGEPVIRIVPHDLEEFNAVVGRYGAWKSDVADFLEAARAGEAQREGRDVF